MRAYADTSFVVKLLVREPGTEMALAEYRRLGRPGMAFLPLHALEVENAIRTKAFHQRHSVPSGERRKIVREETTALDRLEHLIRRGVLLEAAADWEAACVTARDLSRKHTPTTGARSLDLLHIAFALQLGSELFLSADDCQARVASLEGFRVVVVED